MSHFELTSTWLLVNIDWVNLSNIFYNYYFLVTCKETNFHREGILKFPFDDLTKGGASCEYII